MTCSRCFRSAVVVVYGRYRNNREAIDPRCENHIPHADSVKEHSWAFGPRDVQYRIETVERIVA